MDIFRREIPLHEAASYYLGLKKEAEWTDPPDLAGELEGQFAAPLEQVLSTLSEVITAKLRLMMAYYVYAQSLRDPSWHGIKEEFYEHACHEQEGVEYYCKRAVALGGPVHVNEIPPPPALASPAAIMATLLRAEQEMIALQRGLRDLVGDDNPMKAGVEEQMLKDQHHLDELWQMLPEEARIALEQQARPQPEMPEMAPPAGAMEEPLAEAPAEAPLAEKAAALRLARWVKEAGDKSEKPKPSDAELKEVGRQRAVTNMAAEAHREKSRRGERVGETVGRVAGAVGGALLGKKYIGGRAGGKAGKEIGSERDIKKNASALRFQRALHKLADDMAMEGAEMSAPTASEPMATNYLQAELIGQKLQRENEAEFYRSKLMQTQQSTQSLEQQLQAAQQQLQELQMQQNESGAQVQQAMQEAMQARDEAVQQTAEMAKARIGAQKLRQMMLEVASQDPQQLGEQEFPAQPEPMVDPQAGQPVVDPATGQPMPADPAQAGAAPADPAQMNQGAPPAQGAMPPEQPQQPKMASPMLLGALGGAAIAGGKSLLHGHKVDALRSRVQELEADQGGFMAAVRLANARKNLIDAELAQSFPAQSAVRHGLGGALVGGMAAPAVASRGASILRNLKILMGD